MNKLNEDSRLKTGINTLDALLGGGLLKGSVILINGEDKDANDEFMMNIARLTGGKSYVVHGDHRSILESISGQQLDLDIICVRLPAEERESPQVSLDIVRYASSAGPSQNAPVLLSARAITSMKIMHSVDVEIRVRREAQGYAIRICKNRHGYTSAAWEKLPRLPV